MHKGYIIMAVVVLILSGFIMLYDWRVEDSQDDEITQELMENMLISKALNDKGKLSAEDQAVWGIIKQNVISCRDNDGLNFNKKGKVEVILEYEESQKTFHFEDRCHTDGAVLEFGCQKNLPRANLKRCYESCADGACISKGDSYTPPSSNDSNLCPPPSSGDDDLCHPLPTCSNVVYGSFNDDSSDYNPNGDRNVFDLWLADSDTRTPLVVFIHGGGFYTGSKESIYEECYQRDDTSLIKVFLDAGVSVASINYRLTKNPEWAYTREWYDKNPTPAPMLDAAKAIWFLRSHASDYNIDPSKVAATGKSAGGGISFWLAFHDDLEISSDISTKPNCIGPWIGQSTYDAWVIYNDVLPGTPPDGFMHSFFNLDDEFDISNIDDNLDARYKEASPVTHITRDDPPVFMHYTARPYDQGGAAGNMHDPHFGLYAEQFLQNASITYELHFPGHDGLLKPEAALAMKDFFFEYCFS